MLGLNHFLRRLGERSYSVQLRCFSAPFFSHADSAKIDVVNYGGKILLPNSALDALTRMNIEYPMLFKITNPDINHQLATHAGVLEFSADEGKCYLPSWMMNQLHLSEGQMATIEYASLPKATYAKFKPRSTEFLHISNPRAMLEVELRKFGCLSKNDVIAVKYNDQILEFIVMDVKPGHAVTIIECDINLEFDAPEGYVEPTTSKSIPKKAESNEEEPAFVAQAGGFSPFSGQGMRLDGKPIKADKQGSAQQAGSSKSNLLAPAPQQPQKAKSKELVVDENYVPGRLLFPRN